MHAATGFRVGRANDRSIIHGSRTLLPLVLIALFAVPLVRTAWMSDDAYITLRTIDNFVNGYGLRWNVAERVQSYTDPLWMLLLAGMYAVTREAYFTSLFVSMAISVVAFALVVTKLASSWRTAVIGASVLVFSKAFVDYSTSGLENPLTHLLLAMLLLLDRRRAEPRALTWMWVNVSLLLLTRLDLALLVVPLVVARSWSVGGRRALAAAAVGLLPVLAWEVFSLVYYGFPFPNTAYAKLQTGVPTEALLAQGLAYLRDSIEQDPVTLVSIVALTVVSAGARPREHWPFALGVALYGAYVVAIGGDFMSGRFLTAPLFYAVAAFVREPWQFRRELVAACSIALAGLGVFATARPPVTSGPDTILEVPRQAIARSGISDERAFYYRDTGLLRWSRQLPLPHTVSVEHGRALRAAPGVVYYGQVGFFGYYAGPEAHVVDMYGLCDALLARLPAEPDWRIGHYQRNLPEGYLETIQTGRNVIKDLNIGMRYERLKLITQGPIWSRRRWRAIVEMNLRG